MSNYVSPDARSRSGNPAISRPGFVGSPGDITIAPDPPKNQGVPSSRNVIARLLKLPVAKPYRNSALLLNIAKARYVDPVALLLAAIGTDTANTNEALNSLANRLREGIKGKNSVDGWLRSVNGRPTESLLRKARAGSYVYSFPQNPQQKVTAGLETAYERELRTNPFVAGVDAKGREITTRDESKALRLFNAPVQVDDFLRAKSHYNDYYTRYLGREAKPKELLFLMKGVSESAVQKMLSKDPAFKRGPLYQDKAPSIIGYAKGLLGEGWKVDPEFVRKAIVGSWDEGALNRRLRQRPEYLKGPEFRQNVAALTNVHQTIFGRPDDKQLIGIKESALGGWSTDMYASYLRASADYPKSQEYQAKALSFLDALGLITGQQPTSQDVAMLGQPNNPNIAGPLPNSPRIPGNEPKPQPGIGPGLAVGIQKVGQAVGGKSGGR